MHKIMNIGLLFFITTLGAQSRFYVDGSALTFDDVLLVPAYSEVLPKQTCLSTQVTREITLPIPLMSAAMDTVTDANLAIALAREGGIGVIHKNMSVEEQASHVRQVKSIHALSEGACIDALGRLRVGAAVGVDAASKQRVDALSQAGVDLIVVDSAHGHSRGVIEMVQWIKKSYPVMQVVAGNVATPQGARALVDAGADAVKVGIGPGSICTTRVVTGVGVPQVSALNLIALELKGSGVPIIADGGIRFSGDVCKALAAGASVVMIGNLFAGTEEAAGGIEILDGKPYKAYRGMGSLGAMSKAHGSSDRYFQSTHEGCAKLVPEGIEGRVPCRGSVVDVVRQLTGGIRSSLGYLGCRTIEEMHERAQFIRITNAGLRESHVHDVSIATHAPNYTLHN